MRLSCVIIIKIEMTAFEIVSIPGKGRALMSKKHFKEGDVKETFQRRRVGQSTIFLEHGCKFIS